MIVTKRSAVLLLGIMVILVIVNVQPVDAAVDEYLYVHTDDNTYDADWTEVGSTPWVDAQDQPTNEGWVSASNDLWGNFLIDDTTGTGTVNSISLDVYCDSATEKIEFYVYDLSATQFVLMGEDSGSGGYHSNSFDISSFITTVAEIDAIEVYAKSKNIGSWGGSTVRLDYVVIHVNVEVVSGTDYTAYPDGDLTLTGSPSLLADFVATLAEGFSLAGSTSLIAGFVKTLIEGFSLAGSPSLIADFVATLIDGFALTGSTSPIAYFVATLIESFALAGPASIFVIIQQILVESFGLSGATSLVVNFSVLLASGFALAGVTSLIASFSVRLSVGFTLGGAVSAAVSYVKTLIEGFSLGGTISAFKVLIVNLADSFSFGVGVDILKIVGTSLIGSMFFQLFFGLSMWGYLGPIGLVIVGYVLTNKEKNLGILFFIVESLVIANYLTLVSATPDYWWHTFILLIGCISTLMYSVLDRR